MKKVSPSYYTKRYYLKDCSGFKTYSKNLLSDPRYRAIIRNLPKVKGKRVLDIGCGRGEMVVWSIKNKAREAVGIDYSINAIKLANKLLLKLGKKKADKASFIKMDATDIKFKRNSFDIVFLIEVVEHLYPDQVEELFGHIKRILKPNGILVFHTDPNRYFNDLFYKYWVYPLSTSLLFLNRFIGNKYYPNLPKPENLRGNSHKIMHVNEMNYYQVKKLLLRYGFKGYLKSLNTSWNKPPVGWKDKMYNLLVFLNPISKIFPFMIFSGQDFFGVLTNKNRL